MEHSDYGRKEFGQNLLASQLRELSYMTSAMEGGIGVTEEQTK